MASSAAPPLADRPVKVEVIDEEDHKPEDLSLALLHALEKRDQDRKEAKAAAKKAAKAEAKAEAKAAAAKKAPKEASPAPKSKDSDASSPSEKTFKQPASAPVKAFFAPERTRCQIMARTGLGGQGSSKRFKYGDEEDYAKEEAATVAAQKWVDELNRARGLMWAFRKEGGLTESARGHSIAGQDSQDQSSGTTSSKVITIS